jgi:hypothetical protein
LLTNVGQINLLLRHYFIAHILVKIEVGTAATRQAFAVFFDCLFLLCLEVKVTEITGTIFFLFQG